MVRTPVLAASVCGQVSVGEPTDRILLDQAFIGAAAIRRQVSVGKTEWKRLEFTSIPVAAVCGQVFVGEDG